VEQREEPIDHALSPSSTPTAQRTPRRRHILLVEENLINRKIVHRKLQSKGHDVTTANDGQEALELVIEAPGLSTGDSSAFDICLMDMEMPRMDGNSATKAIREREKQDQPDYLPILGVTANVRSGQQSEM
jgi:CheY-like chemotaxis protein